MRGRVRFLDPTHPIPPYLRTTMPGLVRGQPAELDLAYLARSRPCLLTTEPRLGVGSMETPTLPPVQTPRSGGPPGRPCPPKAAAAGDGRRVPRSFDPSDEARHEVAEPGDEVASPYPFWSSSSSFSISSSSD